MIKPRIRLIRAGIFVCFDKIVSQCGTSARSAYDAWLIASLKDAMRPPPPPPKKKEVIKKAPAKKVADYNESLVHCVPGTVTTKPYSLAKELRINADRAAKVQTPMTTQGCVGNGYASPLKG